MSDHIPREGIENGFIGGALVGMAWAIRSIWMRTFSQERSRKVEPADVKEAVAALRAELLVCFTRIETEMRRTTDVFNAFLKEEERVHDAITRGLEKK